MAVSTDDNGAERRETVGMTDASRGGSEREVLHEREYNRWNQRGDG